MATFIIPTFIFITLIILSLIMFNPFVGLYVFTWMLYLKPGAFHPMLGNLYLTRLVAAITLLVLLFQSKKYGKIIFLKHKLSKLLITFVVFMCLSTFTSIWRSNTITFIFEFLKIILAYIMIINLSVSLKRCKLLVWAMVLSMVYISIVSLHEYQGFGRLFGALRGALFGDPNDLALGLIVLIPFVFYGLFSKKNFFMKAVNLAVLGLFFYIIILTQSRGGLIGMSAMLIALWWKSKAKIIGVICLAIFIFVGWKIAPAEYKERMMTIETASEEDAAAISRLDAWTAGRNMMMHKLFGVGLGNFKEGYFHYKLEGALGYAGTRRASHNMYIQVGGETGVPGLIVFCLMLLSSFGTLNRVIKRMESFQGDQAKEILLFSNAVFVALVGYCASGIFLSQAYNWILYYFIAFAVLLDGFSLKLMNNEK